MTYMFGECKSLTNLDLSTFDTSKVYNMFGMFICCESLLTLNVSNWNVENVDTMNSLFYMCNNVTADCSKWNVSNVTDHRDFGNSSNIIRPHWSK